MVLAPPIVRDMPEDPKIRALCRPSDYGQMNPHQKREIDRELDLLDWDGVE
jgi:hypothetical protein